MVSVGSRIPQLPDIVLASVSAGLVGFVAAAGGWFLGLDYSAKLFVLTFVLVVMGAQTGAGGVLEHVSCAIWQWVAPAQVAMLLTRPVWEWAMSAQAVNSLLTSALRMLCVRQAMLCYL